MTIWSHQTNRKYTVNLSDFELAFEMVNDDNFESGYAYIHKQTHEIVWDDEAYTGAPCPVPSARYFRE